jgi:hypothetical protein
LDGIEFGEGLKGEYRWTYLMLGAGRELRGAERHGVPGRVTQAGLAGGGGQGADGVGELGDGRSDARHGDGERLGGVERGKMKVKMERRGEERRGGEVDEVP